MSDSLDNNDKNINIPKMPVNRSHLDALADKFSETHDPQDFSAFMVELENSMVIVPAEAPADMNDEIREAAKQGKPLPIDPNNQPKVRLLKGNDGTMILPIFTSPLQIPADKRPPAFLNMPFKAVIDIYKANASKVGQIGVNPFTKGFGLNDNLVNLVDQRFRAKMNGQAEAGKEVKLTENQLHAIAHVKMSYELLPKKIFSDPQTVISDIKLQKEKYIMNAYKEVYPKNVRVPYSEDDIAVMSLQIEDDLVITRIDLPEKFTQEGSPLRVYITEQGERIGYYMIEKGAKGKPGMISYAGPDGTYKKLEEAPDNGAEIETIMSLIRPS
ncbi:MAG: SseB family protein [Lachnospiraceae bacterium]|nr:SseB family protein [Lachnospiraceae bacterium]